MGRESSYVVRFDLGYLLQGESRIAKTLKCLQLTYYWSYRFEM